MNNKKYKLKKDKDSGLYRIIALVDIPCFDVKIGDVGGLIQSEKNLSHSGRAWVSDEAWISGRARIYGDAHISGGKFSKSPLYIQGSKSSLCNCSPGILRIGCIELPIKDWVKNYKSIGRKNGYKKAEIEEYFEYIMLFDKLLRE